MRMACMMDNHLMPMDSLTCHMGRYTICIISFYISQLSLSTFRKLLIDIPLSFIRCFLKDVIIWRINISPGKKMGILLPQSIDLSVLRLALIYIYMPYCVKGLGHNSLLFEDSLYYFLHAMILIEYLSKNKSIYLKKKW